MAGVAPLSSTIVISPTLLANFINKYKRDAETPLLVNTGTGITIPYKEETFQSFFNDMRREGFLINTDGERVEPTYEISGSLEKMQADFVATLERTFPFHDFPFSDMTDNIAHIYEQAVHNDIMGFFSVSGVITEKSSCDSSMQLALLDEGGIELTLCAQHSQVNIYTPHDMRDTRAYPCDVTITAVLTIKERTCTLTSVELSGRQALLFRALMVDEIDHQVICSLLSGKITEETLQAAITRRKALIEGLPTHGHNHPLSDDEKGRLLLATPLSLFLDYPQHSSFTPLLNTLTEVYGRERMETYAFFSNIMACVSATATNDDVHMRAIKYFSDYFEYLQTTPLVHLADDDAAPTPAIPQQVNKRVHRLLASDSVDAITDSLLFGGEPTLKAHDASGNKTEAPVALAFATLSSPAALGEPVPILDSSAEAPTALKARGITATTQVFVDDLPLHFNGTPLTPEERYEILLAAPAHLFEANSTTPVDLLEHLGPTLVKIYSDTPPELHKHMILDWAWCIHKHATNKRTDLSWFHATYAEAKRSEARAASVSDASASSVVSTPPRARAATATSVVAMATAAFSPQREKSKSATTKATSIGPYSHLTDADIAWNPEVRRLLLTFNPHAEVAELQAALYTYASNPVYKSEARELLKTIQAMLSSNTNYMENWRFFLSNNAAALRATRLPGRPEPFDNLLERTDTLIAKLTVLQEAIIEARAHTSPGIVYSTVRKPSELMEMARRDMELITIPSRFIDALPHYVGGPAFTADEKAILMQLTPPQLFVDDPTVPDSILKQRLEGLMTALESIYGEEYMNTPKFIIRLHQCINAFAPNGNALRHCINFFADKYAKVCPAGPLRAVGADCSAMITMDRHRRDSHPFADNPPASDGSAANPDEPLKEWLI